MEAELYAASASKNMSTWVVGEKSARESLNVWGLQFPDV